MSDFDEAVPDESEQLDQLDSGDSLMFTDLDDPLDAGWVPPDRWSAGEGFGNTAAEMRRGETLDQRLLQEEPEPDPDDWDEDELDDGEVGDRRSGRLVDANSGYDGEDVDSEMYGEDVGIDGAGASAEEAAVHIVGDWDRR